MIFCDKIRQELMETKSKAFIISGGDKRAFKEVLEWIKDCASRESMVKFKEVCSPTQSPSWQSPDRPNLSSAIPLPLFSCATPMQSQQRRSWAFLLTTSPTASTIAC